MTMLRLENIGVTYGKLEVLKSINLTINQGGVTSIVGPSGAGKSTLLHIMGTLDRPDKGNIYYDNELINTFNDKKLSRFRNLNIGFVFQFHYLLNEFSALENICIPALIKGERAEAIELKALKLMAELGIENRAKHRPSELSGGEQQRVAVCRALINDSRIILADEPSGNLDTSSADNLHKLFFKLAREFNKTIILVTHNIKLASQSDRIISLKDGQVIS